MLKYISWTIDFKNLYIDKLFIKLINTQRTWSKFKSTNFLVKRFFSFLNLDWCAKLKKDWETIRTGMFILFNFYFFSSLVSMAVNQKMKKKTNWWEIMRTSVFRIFIYSKLSTNRSSNYVLIGNIWSSLCSIRVSEGEKSILSLFMFFNMFFTKFRYYVNSLTPNIYRSMCAKFTHF